MISISRLTMLLACALPAQLSEAQTPAPAPAPVAQPTEAADTPKPPAPAPVPVDPSWKSLGKSIWFDPANRRLILETRLVLREGELEHFLCLFQSKEHESILATGAAARAIHAGLLLTGAKPGRPVQFLPDFKPPEGSPMRLTVRWLGPDGKAAEADAREWVKDRKSGGPLKIDWVFGGSLLIKDPDTAEVMYAAESGDLFTVSNFANAILDLPIASSADNSALTFSAFTEHLPPLDTPVQLILEPVQKPQDLNRLENQPEERKD